MQPGQNLIDIAMQLYGSIDALQQLCIDNGISVGAHVPAGTQLLLNESGIISKKLINFYRTKQLDVATGSGIVETESQWILASGIWNDNKIWIDEEFWKDN